jgi:voltage-gated potassium channel
MKHTFSFATLGVVILTPLIVGTIGYLFIEGWPLLDAMYMSIITLSTVGYGETQELSETGRVFTTALIAISMMCMAFWTAGITSIIVGGELTGKFRKQKEAKMISQLSNHTIVCGGGLMARTVINQLCQEGKDVVAVMGSENDIALMQRLYPNLLIVHGDPKSELALADANAINADFLVAAVESDYDNLLITITGKGLGTDIKIISCAQGNELASRMHKVGADKVICPFVLGGEQAAKMIA